MPLLRNFLGLPNAPKRRFGLTAWMPGSSPNMTTGSWENGAEDLTLAGHALGLGDAEKIAGGTR